MQQGISKDKCSNLLADIVHRVIVMWILNTSTKKLQRPPRGNLQITSVFTAGTKASWPWGHGFSSPHCWLIFKGDFLSKRSLNNSLMWMSFSSVSASQVAALEAAFSSGFSASVVRKLCPGSGKPSGWLVGEETGQSATWQVFLDIYVEVRHWSVSTKK